MMYACFDNSAGLSPNQSFKRLVESDVTVYGDVYVFKMEPDVIDGFANFVDVDESFIESARVGGIHARLILRRLLECDLDCNAMA